MERLASAQERDRERDDHQNFNEAHEDLENNDSDLDDDQFFVDDEEEEFSSPSTNSDGLQFNNNNPWYAYRGRINLFENGQQAGNVELNLPQQNALQHPEPQQQQLQQPQQQQQLQNDEEEETDFLEMDFEPENSEIENENELINGHNINHVNGNCEHLLDNPMQQALENFNQFLPPRPQLFLQNNQNHHSTSDEGSSNQQNVEQQEHKYTGAKPKILKQPLNDAGRCQKPVKQRQVTDGDHIFKITGHFSSYEDRFCDQVQPGCSNSSSVYRNSYHHQSDSPSTSSSSFLSKPHNKSPIKSCHNSRKQKQEFIEKQNNQFLFEIEPIKPRNSVTIYTSNCDEKILLDALLSLKLNPNREMIVNYFNKLKLAIDLELVDYIIFRSKLNCNYIKIIELIENSCKLEDNEYNLKKLDINFYPLDFFSTTPETIEIEVEEIIKRWTSQTDLSPLACIKNKYFHQTNVLGKIVNVIRKMINGNHKPGTVVFLDNETIKIPQYYVSGYITITLRNHQT